MEKKRRLGYTQWCCILPWYLSNCDWRWVRWVSLLAAIAHFWKKCCHFCVIESVRESCGFCGFKLWAMTTIVFFMWKWIFMDFARTFNRPKQRPSLGSFRSFTILWVKTRHRNKSAWLESNPMQGSRSKSTLTDSTQRPVKKCASAPIWMEGQSHFRWRCAEALKRSLAWVWTNSNSSLQPKGRMKSDARKLFKDLHWLSSFDFWSIYLWATPSNFSLLNFLRSMPSTMSIEQRMCGETIIQSYSISNAIICIDQSFAVKFFGAHNLTSVEGLGFRTFNLINLKMKIQHAKVGSNCEIWQFINHLFGHINTILWLSG